MNGLGCDFGAGANVQRLVVIIVLEFRQPFLQGTLHRWLFVVELGLPSAKVLSLISHGQTKVSELFRFSFGEKRKGAGSDGGGSQDAATRVATSGVLVVGINIESIAPFVKGVKGIFVAREGFGRFGFHRCENASSPFAGVAITVVVSKPENDGIHHVLGAAKWMLLPQLPR